jgi:hypothetical protein
LQREKRDRIIETTPPGLGGTAGAKGGRPIVGVDRPRRATTTHLATQPESDHSTITHDKMQKRERSNLQEWPCTRKHCIPQHLAASVRGGWRWPLWAHRAAELAGSSRLSRPKPRVGAQKPQWCGKKETERREVGMRKPARAITDAASIDLNALIGPDAVLDPIRILEVRWGDDGRITLTIERVCPPSGDKDG